jgi:hypothetical protein
MFYNNKRYSVPAGVESKSRQIGFGGTYTSESLDELGVTEAVHFGSFAAGEMFHGRSSRGQAVIFLVDPPQARNMKLLDKTIVTSKKKRR